MMKTLVLSLIIPSLVDPVAMGTTPKQLSNSNGSIVAGFFEDVNKVIDTVEKVNNSSSGEASQDQQGNGFSEGSNGFESIDNNSNTQPDNDGSLPNNNNPINSGDGQPEDVNNSEGYFPW